MGTRLSIRDITPRLLVVGGILLLLIALPRLFSRSDFSIDVFDVGQGDAILITAPTGERILVDGGPDASVVEKLSQRLGFFNRKIDFVLVSHPQADHITGLLSVLDRFDVQGIMLTALRAATPEYRALKEKIAGKHIPVIDATSASALTIGTDPPMTIDVLWPRRSFEDRGVDDPNDIATVFRLTYGETQFIFTGDAGAVVEDALLAAGVDVRADVLKVGHHGSDTSTTQDFLHAVAPSIALISVGRANRFGHPSRRVLKRLERKGVATYRTDVHGDIHITSDGKKIRVSPERR